MNDRVGQQFGNYRLIRLLGRGGFAEVYLGEHVHLKTLAAIKVLRDPLPEANRERFHIEARLIASLVHPHIVRVLDFGIDQKEDLPFLVMEFAPGGSLRQAHPHGSMVPLDSVDSYVTQVASALKYIHDQLDNASNRRMVHCDVKPENMLLDGDRKVLLSDFGLAIVVQTTEPRNHQEEIFGTQPYMAPEQLLGKPRRASDQYALGVVVYEWLTGTYPFGGSWRENALKLVDDPPSLRVRARSLPLDVDKVVRQALARNHEERFADVMEFATALKQAVRASKRTTEESPPEGVLYIYRGHGTQVKALAWSPNGHRIVSVGTLGPVHVWNASTGGNVRILSGHTRPINDVAWSPNDLLIASGGQGGTVRVWHAPTDSRIFRDHTSSVTAVTWSPDSKHIASVSQDRTLKVWNSRGWAFTFPVPGHTGDVLAVAWSPSPGRYIVTGSLDRTVRIWDVVSQDNVGIYHEHSDTVKAVTWSPDGQYIASAGNDKEVQVWEAMTRRLHVTYRGHADSINALSWSPDKLYIASASSDGTVQVWSALTGTHVFTYHNHTQAVYAVAWSPDGKYVASGSADGTVQVWRVVTRSPAGLLVTHDSPGDHIRG